jgi:hypothetical protein
MFNASFLFASLVWGSIGVGYCIYGKKQQSFPAMLGGILMVGCAARRTGMADRRPALLLFFGGGFRGSSPFHEVIKKPPSRVLN